jgi:MIP family channel proteins
MNADLKAVLAEFFGTFTLVFIGAGAGALAAQTGIGTLGVALAHGIALMVIVYTWGAVSGAHVNPAVTFGLAVAGELDWMKAVYYWIAQFIGAAAAAYLLAWFVGASSDVAGLGATVGSLTATDGIRTVAVEAVLTFFLVTAVFGTAVAGRSGNAAGLAIGFVLAMDILMGGSLTGASMNPARTFGPALVTGHLGDYFWMYLLGPAIGGGLAALVYGQLLLVKSPARAKPARRSAGNKK